METLKITTYESYQAMRTAAEPEGYARIQGRGVLYKYNNGKWRLNTLCPEDPILNPDSHLDYTAFEVFPHSEELPVGYTETGKLVVAYGMLDTTVELLGDNGVDANVSNSENARIPAGMTEKIQVWTLRGGETLYVSWGDGYVTTATTVDNNYIVISHTYATTGRYIVKVFGDNFCNISPAEPRNPRTNLISRCLANDLPLASNHISLQRFAQFSMYLYQVIAPSWTWYNQINTLNQTFERCYNLKSVMGFSRVAHVHTCKNCFAFDISLTSSDFRIPGLLIHTAESARYTYSNCWSLTSNIANLLPSEGFISKKVDLSYIFYCNQAAKHNVPLTGTVPANILWDDPNVEFVTPARYFGNACAAIRAQVPTSWGGTNASIVPCSSIQQTILTGGTTGQVLTKTSDAVEWADVEDSSAVPTPIRSIVTLSSGTVNCSNLTNIYKLTLDSNTTIELVAPTLESGQTYQCELWLKQPSAPVTVTFPTIKWDNSTPPVMDAEGSYHIGLEYDGTDWYGKLILKSVNTFSGDLYNGDSGVFVYVDGNLVSRAPNATDIDVSLTDASVYVMHNPSDDDSIGVVVGGTVSAASSIYAGTYIDMEPWVLSGGTVSGVTVYGGVGGYDGTYVNCTFESGSSFIGSPTNITFSGCTIKGNFTTEMGSQDGGLFENCVVTGSSAVVNGMLTTITGCTFSNNAQLEGTNNDPSNITISSGGQVAFDGGTITDLVNNGGLVQFAGMYGTINGYTQTAGSIDGLWSGVNYDETAMGYISNFMITGGSVGSPSECRLRSGTITIGGLVFQDAWELTAVTIEPTSGTVWVSNSSTVEYTNCVFGANCNVCLDESNNNYDSTMMGCTFKSGATLYLFSADYSVTNNNHNLLKSGSTLIISFASGTVSSGTWYAEAGVTVTFDQAPSNNYTTSEAGYITLEL